MKRIALSLMALALTGAVAFAQDAPVAKLSGYVDSGIKATSVDNGAFDVTSYANDYGAAGTWGKVAVSVETDTYGAKVTAQASDAASASIADSFAWYSPFEGVVVSAGTSYGKVSFDGLDDQSNDYFWHNGYGITYTNSGFSVGVNGGVKALGFGAAYSLDKLFTVHASADTVGKKLSNFEVSGSLTAVEKLSLSAGYLSTARDTTAVNWADAAASYAITDALTAGVLFYDYIDGAYLTIQPNASYVVAPGITLSGFYQYYTDKQADVDGKIGAESEIKAKISLAAGPGTWASWVDYKVAAKVTTLETDYVISF